MKNNKQKEIKSDIHGKGFGDSYNWERGQTNQVKDGRRFYMAIDNLFDKKLEEILDRYADWIKVGDTKKSISQIKSLFLEIIEKTVLRDWESSLFYAQTEDENKCDKKILENHLKECRDNLSQKLGLEEK